MKYQIETLAMIVVPEGDPVFSEMATRIEIEDEASGPFLRISQTGPGKGIALSANEWPAIREAIEEMLATCDRLVGKK